MGFRLSGFRVGLGLSASKFLGFRVEGLGFGV